VQLLPNPPLCSSTLVPDGAVRHVDKREDEVEGGEGEAQEQEEEGGHPHPEAHHLIGSVAVRRAGVVVPTFCF